jgi:DMSO/TMAO reductase YedYZ heme-binding membrane subunit
MQEKRRGKRMAVASNTPQVVALLRGVRVGMAALLLLTLLTPGSAQSSNLKGDGAQLSLNPTVPISTFQQPILVNAPLAQKSEWCWSYRVRPHLCVPCHFISSVHSTRHLCYSQTPQSVL